MIRLPELVAVLLRPLVILTFLLVLLFALAGGGAASGAEPRAEVTDSTR